MARVDGWAFEDAELIAAKLQVDARAAQRWLPVGLRARGTATVFVAHYPRTSFGSVYNEAAVFLDVTHFGLAAVHCPWILVDDDVALILGRELLGYPKKMGTIAIDRDGDAVAASVCRRGVEVLRLRGELGAEVATPPPMLQRRMRNATGGLGLTVQRLVGFTIKEEILSCRRAQLQLEITASSRDPLHELGCGPVLEGYAYRLNMGAHRRSVPLPLGLISPLFAARNFAARYH